MNINCLICGKPLGLNEHRRSKLCDKHYEEKRKNDIKENMKKYIEKNQPVKPAIDENLKYLYKIFTDNGYSVLLMLGGYNFSNKTSYDEFRPDIIVAEGKIPFAVDGWTCIYDDERDQTRLSQGDFYSYLKTMNALKFECIHRDGSRTWEEAITNLSYCEAYNQIWISITRRNLIKWLEENNISKI